MTAITVSEWVSLDHSVMHSHSKFLGCHSLVVEPVLDGVRIQHGQLWTNVGN